jgi:tRNA pseudouridine55 synthase
MKGLLYINKQEGWTSFDVVNYVRKMVAGLENRKARTVKVGHTGTLDPAATGLLVLAVGKEFTRQMPQLMKQDKTYEVEITLGKTSTTGDREGEIVEKNDRKPTLEEAEAVLRSFLGESEQVPPQFSAIKVEGKRAYDMARAGKRVELKARPIRIDTIELAEYSYPILRFSCRVSSGTYIRSLAEDIGLKLGTGAYMSALHRTSIGAVTIAQAVAVSELTEEHLQKMLAD